MCCPCMIATIPLVTENKLNCFISARGILTIIRHCAFVLSSFVDSYMLINHLLKKKTLKVNPYNIYGAKNN